jgi:hypothetical protein
MESLGFSGRLIHRHPIDNKPSQLVVLSSDPQADPKAEESFQKTLSEFDVRFVPFRSAEEFAQEVETTAH